MFWLIALIPLALIIFVLFLKVRLCLIFENDLVVRIKILLFNIDLFPKKQKKLKPSDYSLKKLERKQKKLAKKQKKKQPQEKIEPQPTAKPAKAEKIKDVLDIVKIVLENVMSPFGKYLKVEIIKLYVRIGTDDAARTALVYGLVSQTASYIIGLLSHLTNVDIKKKNSINISPDFLSETSEAAINITLGLRGWHALVLATKFFMGYIKHKYNKTLKSEEK